MISNSDHVFISYSRKQFYFTESLVLHLRKRGMKTWFDMQCLKPGSNWELSLREGYNTCAGLILVASQASLASDYVQKEWEEVYKVGKPIYVVLFEPVQLPYELEHGAAAIIDFRGNFKQGLERLLEIIQCRIYDRDPLPKLNILRLPTGLPVNLWSIMSLLWFDNIFSALLFIPLIRAYQSGLIGNQLFYSTSLLLSGSIIATSYYALAFTYRWRSASYRTIRIILWALPLDILGMAFLVRIEIPAIFFLISLLLLAIGGLMSLVLSHLDDVIRWFPTGTLPEKVRRRQGMSSEMAGCSESAPEHSHLHFGSGFKSYYPIKRTGLFVEHGFIDTRYDIPETRTYWLHYDVEDEICAKNIKDILKEIDFFTEKVHVSVDVHILLLTDKTSRDWASKAIYMYPQGLYIVASSIYIHKKEKNFHRLQWLDYRLRQKDDLKHQLERVRELLQEPLLQENYNYPAVPESLQRFIVPPKIFWFSQTIMALGGYPLGIGISSLFTLFLHRSMDFPAPIIPFWLLSGCLSIWLGFQISTFSLAYRIQLILLSIVMISDSVATAISSSMMPGISSSHPMISIVISSSVFLIGLVVFYLSAHRIFKEQLPRHTRLFSRRQTLCIPFWRRDLPMYILLLLGVIEVIFLHIFS